MENASKRTTLILPPSPQTTTTTTKMNYSSFARLIVVCGESFSACRKELVLSRFVSDLMLWDAEATGLDLSQALRYFDDQEPKKTVEPDGQETLTFISPALHVEVEKHVRVRSLGDSLTAFRCNRQQSPFVLVVFWGLVTCSSSSSSSSCSEVNLPRIVKWPLRDGLFDAGEFTDFDRRRDRNLTALAIYGDRANIVHAPNLQCRRGSKDQDQLHRFSLRLLDFFDDEKEEKEKEMEEFRSDPGLGPLYFQQPTLYIFPSGPGCSSFFGVEEFTMLIDAGYSRRRVASWELVRRLERLDVLLVTNHGQNNIGGLRAMLARMLLLLLQEQCPEPQIGCAFMNCPGKNDSRFENVKWQSEDNAEKGFHLESSSSSSSSHSRTEVNPAAEAVGAADDLRRLKVQPRTCEASASQSHVCLYRKVGAGSLCLDVLQPDDETSKQYLQQLDAGCILIDKTAKLPFSELASICAVLHWSPASSKDKLIRILFTGSCPQSAVFKGLAEWREREASVRPYGKMAACAGDFRDEVTISTRCTSSEADANDAHQIKRVVENVANKEAKRASRPRRGKISLEPGRGIDVRKNNANRSKSGSRAKGKLNAKCNSNVRIDTNVKMSSKGALKGKSLNCKQATVTTKQGKGTCRDTASVIAAKTGEVKNDSKPTDVYHEVEDEWNSGKAETVCREGTRDLDKTKSLKSSTVCSETEKDADVRENESVTFSCTVVDAVETRVVVIPVIHSTTALEERDPNSNVPDSKDFALTAVAFSSKSEISDGTDNGETVRNTIENLGEMRVSVDEEKKVENQLCKASKPESKRGTSMEDSKGKLILPNNKKGSTCQRTHNKEEERGDSDMKKPIGEDRDKTDETKSIRENKEMIVTEKQTSDDACTTEANRQSSIEKQETDEKQSGKNQNKNQELKLIEGDNESLAIEAKRIDEQSKLNCKEKKAVQEDRGKKNGIRTQKQQMDKRETKINGAERIDKTKYLSGSSNYDDNNSIQNNREKLTAGHKGITGAEHGPICSAFDADESRSAVAEIFGITDSTLDRADSLDDLDPIPKSQTQNRSTIHPHQPSTDETAADAFNLRDMLGFGGFSSASLNPFRGMLSGEQTNPVLEALERPLLKDPVMFGRRDIDQDSLDGDDSFDPKQDWGEPMYLPEPDKPDSGRSKQSPGENPKGGCLAEYSTTYPVAEEVLGTGKEGIASTVACDVPAGCLSGVKKRQCCGNANLQSDTLTRYKKILMNHDTANNSENEETDATVTKDPSINKQTTKSNASTLSPDTEHDRRMLGLYEPVYLDVAFIPRGGDPGCVDQEFFRFIRSRYYVLSSNCDDLRILDQLLMAKECWNDDHRVTVIPTHDTKELCDWKTAHTFDLIRLNIDIKEPADRCEINLWGPGTQGFLASCVEFKEQLST